jgi:hypothetical protein
MSHSVLIAYILGFEALKKKHTEQNSNLEKKKKKQTSYIYKFFSVMVTLFLYLRKLVFNQFFSFSDLNAFKIKGYYLLFT